ncbi:MAG: Rrf2 family transcriptional regulator [Aquabacterium sp.]|uniref:RrF2 family transcriptional regulator n=1 Tax=Aquabacterium sp. TaxID=1872578 RepID=UPI0025BB8FEA|nr:Rrf2 family transcriptional regulator [Aquabacterium sp.]MBI5926725.1 Rrf2 family transcriptional regulator [Aquabacterium sp.]
MRLTVYTDYTLRVMMFLAIRHRTGELSRIDDIAQAYNISRSHLTKIVHELGHSGLVDTVRGRSGGMQLAKPPSAITIGEIVRLAEKDFAVVACHDPDSPDICTIQPACNLQRTLRRAMEAFMRELDALTLAQAITAPVAAASLLGIPAMSKISGPRSRKAGTPD